MNDLRNTSDHDLVDSIYAKMSWNNADCEAMSRVCTIKIWFLETEYEKKPENLLKNLKILMRIALSILTSLVKSTHWVRVYSHWILKAKEVSIDRVILMNAYWDNQNFRARPWQWTAQNIKTDGPWILKWYVKVVCESGISNWFTP